jgi:hypothetical protein
VLLPHGFDFFVARDFAAINLCFSFGQVGIFFSRQSVVRALSAAVEILPDLSDGCDIDRAYITNKKAPAKPGPLISQSAEIDQRE